MIIFNIFLIMFYSNFVKAETLESKTGLVMRVIDRYCDQKMTKEVSNIAGYSLIKFNCNKNILIAIVLNFEIGRFIRIELKNGNSKALAILEHRENMDSLEPGPVKRIFRQLSAIYEKTKDKERKAKAEAASLNRLLSVESEDKAGINKIKDLLN